MVRFVNFHYFLVGFSSADQACTSFNTSWCFSQELFIQHISVHLMDAFYFEVVFSEFSIFLRHSLNKVYLTLFNGVWIIQLTNMFRQKIALVYQVVLSKDIVKHDSPALARVDGTFGKVLFKSVQWFKWQTYLQLIVLIFGLEQKYLRTPSFSFSPYSTLKFSLNWKLIDFVIQAEMTKGS